MKVTQVTIGRFHHFHLARAMEQYGMLDTIYTGYPRIKLKEEGGIPKYKIKTFPWIQVPHMLMGRTHVARWKYIDREVAWWSREVFDRYVANRLDKPTVLVGLSGCSLYTGRKVKEMGGYYVCDRGSSHIRFQDQILKEEYARWGLQFIGVDPRVIEKEEREYEEADVITVPSSFSMQSFSKMGVPINKVHKVTYGARLDRFKRIGDPPKDKFRVLWVGAITIRKGFFDLLTAFQQLKHKKKELIVVGALSTEIKQLLAKYDLSQVVFKGQISNVELPKYYSQSHVFVLPSLEEGLAMVQGEALACGCPVIATTNTGAQDLFKSNIEGFIVPIRSPNAILESMQKLIEIPKLREEMASAAVQKVNEIKGWDTYGATYRDLVKLLKK